MPSREQPGEATMKVGWPVRLWSTSVAVGQEDRRGGDPLERLIADRAPRKEAPAIGEHGAHDVPQSPIIFGFRGQKAVRQDVLGPPLAGLRTAFAGLRIELDERVMDRDYL